MNEYWPADQLAIYVSDLRNVYKEYSTLYKRLRETAINFGQPIITSKQSNDTDLKYLAQVIYVGMGIPEKYQKCSVIDCENPIGGVLCVRDNNYMCEFHANEFDKWQKEQHGCIPMIHNKYQHPKKPSNEIKMIGTHNCCDLFDPRKH